MKTSCGIAVAGAGKIPFICFDLAGGGNISGSNVLVGKQGGQLDFLSTAGYSKLGLPGDMVPSIVNPLTASNDFIDSSLGLAFHSDSAFARGILERVSPGTAANINGAVLPARSDNDTSNNPHNPMYGINKAGADGELLTLIGSQNSDSGGNSMAPADMINPKVRPTKIDRPSDVTGLVDTGKLVGLLSQQDAVAVMESIERISAMKLGKVDTKISDRCGGEGSGAMRLREVRRSGGPLRRSRRHSILPSMPASSAAVASSRRPSSTATAEFRKTASIMKLVTNGFAGAGTVSMGGFDYHTGDRSTGELRDLARRSLHRRLPGIRGTRRRTADGLCVQRRFTGQQRHGR